MLKSDEALTFFAVNFNLRCYATVKHVDWSADSLTIASDGADYELLYWDALSGKQTPVAQAGGVLCMGLLRTSTRPPLNLLLLLLLPMTGGY
jgi:hypothetical protein